MSDTEKNDGEPVHLVEDADTGDRFLVYGTDKGMRLDIRYEGETLWMTQAQIGQLFGRDQSVISRHISNVVEEGELPEEGNMQKVHIASSARPVTLHSLDMVISVGYRVSSAQATVFRRWATGILVQFAKKGFVVDSARLKQPENSDRIAELREIIRDIRSDEANLYAELKRICALCQDYDGSTEAAREFYQHTQAKLVYAVTSHTPAEIVAQRANHRVENMGLQTWPKDNIQKRDVGVSKNYLAEGEIKELNRLTTILLDIFEDQLDIGRLVVMQDARDLLDQQLAQLGRAVLKSGGSIRGDSARQKAEAEYVAFDKQRRLERKRDAEAAISALAAEAKKLPKTRRH
ncbi:virulence RhuM family protein [Devosia sp. XJ19-1]|uniref:Virulence RhuM family protein n=1 Tax=Devosia ureilytica TaxID=2952754 RepID=A0A9Q4AN34_9HYPH|nr:RhuM family protein [Devosia ureilytica]MCP8883011.1 virulence RhuM family protein [Devosia ureilytica]MCP8886621.1 virulence RhuM family protein [Devosia ureilytica]